VIPVSGLRSLARPPSSRPGYAFLVTVLVIGVMATATATSLMLLGWAAEQNGFLIERSAQAEQYAKGCLERTFRRLRLEPSYAGGETVAFPKGSCVIHPVTGDGANDRRVCVEGKSGSTTRRFEVAIDEVFPRIKTSSFAEVVGFSLCP
jgi:hypothetical protein